MEVQPWREFLEDQRGVQAAERRTADIFLHVNTAKAECRRLAQTLDRKNFVLIPVARMRHHFIARESAGGALKCPLFLGKLEIHGWP